MPNCCEPPAGEQQTNLLQGLMWLGLLRFLGCPVKDLMILGLSLVTLFPHLLINLISNVNASLSFLS